MFCCVNENWKMKNSTKEQIGRDVKCKSHLAKTARDLYSICPSKLSKRELEDLYFALLENNQDLKKTNNTQQEKLKVLSTKLQRMTAGHKNVAGKEKDCAVKALVDEQKESITELKKINERMAERIRVLNMRLCSAKQFLKRSPSQTCNSKSSIHSFKNTSMTVLNGNNKQSDSNVRSTTASCQHSDKDEPDKATRTVDTETELLPEKEVTEKVCNENKCRTTMDELKEKIINLQEELSTSHDEYTARIAKLETHVSALEEDNSRERGGRAAGQLAAEHGARAAARLRDRLRAAVANCNELSMELAIEKRKVTELQTGLKLANMSSNVVDTIEQLAAAKEEKLESVPEPESKRTRSRHRSNSSETSQKNVEFDILPKARLEVTSSSKTYDEEKLSKADDSGYTELNKSSETEENQVLVKINRELLDKIAELQRQLDILRISAAGANVETRQNIRPTDEPYNNVESIHKVEPKNFESDDNETDDVRTNDTPIKMSEDSGTVLISSMANLDEISNLKPPIAETLKDKDTAVDQYEAQASTSKSWNDKLVLGTEENVEKSINNYNIDRPVSKSDVMIKSSSTVRDNTHNDSRQIPGPVPSAHALRSLSERRKITSKPSKDSYTRKCKKKPNTQEKNVEIIEDCKECCLGDDNQIKNGTSTSKPIDQAMIASNIKRRSVDAEDDHKKEMLEKKLRSMSISDAGASLAGRTPVRDSLYVNHKKLSTLSMSAAEAALAEVKKESATSFFLDSVCTPPKSETVSLSTQVGKNKEIYGTEMEPLSKTNVRDSATYTAIDLPRTYTVKADKKTRTTSSENTDHEISSLSDLPSEKDAKPGAVSACVQPRVASPDRGSPRSSLSAGEEKATMTYSDEETMPTDYGSLSDGEMPIGVNGRRLSMGEKASVNLNPEPPQCSPSEKMEATLQSISEELARCRQLLLSQRPQEKAVEGRASQCSSEKPTKLEGHTLRHSIANRSIANKNTPSCVFILHIGTMVLCDEAVLHYRDKTLVLLWKFYSQNAAMTRVRCGRVIQFDFVTEYDVPFNDDFLNYMKNSAMEIWLCELEKQDEPFAICHLPLHEALLHANLRADMSLALISTTPLSGINNVRVGDEIGVLDLWCNLRADVPFSQTMHHAMHQSTLPIWSNTLPVRRDPKVMQQAIEDELSRSSERLSRDLELSLSASAKHNSQSKSREFTSRKFAIPDEEYLPIEQNDFSHFDIDVDHRHSLPPHQRYSIQKKYIPTPGQLHRDTSGLIINEVPATITSTDEMKRALDKHTQQNNLTRLPKMDDDASLRRSSIPNVKSLAIKHQLSKLRWSKHKSGRDRANSLQEFLKKRDSIRMAAGMNRFVEASKKSVKYTDSQEQPQKETSADSDETAESIDVTILWLALNEECDAMKNASIQKLYVAYTFLGRRGADLETPFSLPKPKHYTDKCYFNFKKTFHLRECDLPLLGHMSRCRAGGGASANPRDCIVFTLVSEPAEDPLELSSCMDIGYAYLYLGDVLAYSGDSVGYTEVVAVRDVRGAVCGLLAVRLDQLAVLRRCLSLSHSHRDLRRSC